MPANINLVFRAIALLGKLAFCLFHFLNTLKVNQPHSKTSA